MWGKTRKENGIKPPVTEVVFQHFIVEKDSKQSSPDLPPARNSRLTEIAISQMKLRNKWTAIFTHTSQSSSKVVIKWQILIHQGLEFDLWAYCLWSIFKHKSELIEPKTGIGHQMKNQKNKKMHFFVFDIKTTFPFQCQYLYDHQWDQEKGSAALRKGTRTMQQC